MFRAFSRPSSEAQWLQWQPLVLPSYSGDSRDVRPPRPRTQHDCHHDTKVKPEVATAVIELLIMGGKTPKTCRAVKKSQDNKQKNVASGWWFVWIKCKTPVPKVNRWTVIWMEWHECQDAIKDCKCLNMRNIYSTECANLCFLKNSSIFLTSNMPQRELCTLHKDSIILYIFWHGQSFVLSVCMNEVTGDVACCTRVESGILSRQENTYRQHAYTILTAFNWKVSA
jgi:hypothetical protein